MMNSAGEPKLLKIEDQEQLRYRISCLLYDFIDRKENILKHLKLPKFEIPWLIIGNQNEPYVTEP